MLTAEQLDDFEKDGYLVVSAVLPEAVLAQVQSAAEELAVAEPEARIRTWHERALFRRPAFRKVLEEPRLIDTAEDILGPDVQLLALDVLLTRPGDGGVGWHRDVSFACSKTLSVNCGMYMRDTNETGPLRVVPGIHRWDTLPEGDPSSGVIEVPARAGDAVFFDAALWHAGNKNRSNGNRIGLFAFFGRYWIKRMDNYFRQLLPAALLDSQDPRTRQLLGLGLRPGVLSYSGDEESYNLRGEPGIDFS